MNPPPQSKSVGGFTLVEMLVVLALTGLLVTGLYQAFRIGSHAADRANPDRDSVVQFALVQDFMDRELAAAVPLPSSSSPDQAVQFDGQADAISFVAVAPAFLSLGGFEAFKLQLTKGRLEVSSGPLARDSSELATGPLRPSVLMENVQKIVFAYFGIVASGEPPGWSDRWVARGSLPTLVRLRITLANGARSPDMIIAPRLR